VKLIGLDPGLRRTGWGVIDVDGNRLRHVAHGTVIPDASAPFSERLCQLFDGVLEVIREQAPDEAAVEETFVNRNPDSTLKLGQARGVVMLAPARQGLPVAEYPANLVKKSVVGNGHADKRQIHAMIRVLLPGVTVSGADAADALAVAVCHAHHRATAARWRPATVERVQG
jgi:crossover junction endodeoxyribonuclease RuvC